MLHEKYILSIKNAKISYSANIVKELKSSNPAQWYSKVKLMANVNKCTDEETYVEELVSNDHRIRLQRTKVQIPATVETC